MAARGEYGMNALSQRKYIDEMMPDIEKELKDDLTLYDLGCADGINSMYLVGQVRKHVRNLTVGLVDLPANDWITARFMIENQVDYVAPDGGTFQTPHSAVNDRGVLAADSGKFGELISGSFYGPVTADYSVDVFVSSSAVDLLSDPARNPEPKFVAEEDWLRFLRAREKELRPRGTLFVSALARRMGPDVRVPKFSQKGVYDVVKKTLRSAVENKAIPREKARDWFFPVYSRSEEEWKKPFDDGNVPGLKLEKLELVAVQSPYWELAQEQDDGGSHQKSRANFADFYVPSVVGWLGPYMTQVLGPKVVDHFKADLWQAVYDNPRDFLDDYLEAVMVIRKVDDRKIEPLPGDFGSSEPIVPPTPEPEPSYMQP